MRWFCIVLLLFTGCFTSPTLTPSPLQQRISQSRDRPEDMTRRVLSNKKLKCACGLTRVQFPDWLKSSYAQWIRYAYDLEPGR